MPEGVRPRLRARTVAGPATPGPKERAPPPRELSSSQPHSPAVSLEGSRGRDSRRGSFGSVDAWILRRRVALSQRG
jgi:hypothetical protein